MLNTVTWQGQCFIWTSVKVKMYICCWLLPINELIGNKEWLKIPWLEEAFTFKKKMSTILPFKGSYLLIFFISCSDKYLINKNDSVYRVYCLVEVKFNFGFLI